MSETYDEVIRQAANYFDTKINCIADPPRGGVLRVRVHIFGSGGTFLRQTAAEPVADDEIAVDIRTGEVKNSFCIRRVTSVNDDESYPWWEEGGDPEYAFVRSFALHLQLDELLGSRDGMLALRYFFGALLLENGYTCAILTS